jgi:predicted deacylase
VYEPAIHRTTDRRLGALPSGREVGVTVHRYGGSDGPTVYVQAAQHGIELAGPAALRRLHDRLVGADLAGEVIVVPVANPLAFDGRSYVTPATYDAVSPNMNRRWPGDTTGSLVERFIAELWPLAESADAVVDLHTGTREMLPHVRHRHGDQAARRLATAFGTDYRLVDQDPGGDAAATGKFRVAAARADIPAVTAELGNSRAVSPEAAVTGADGVEQVLQALDVRPGTPDPPTEQVALMDAPAPVEAPASGLFEPARGITVGESLAAETTLGTVYDPASFEALATLTTPDEGVLYSLGRGSVIAGERLAALGAPA